MKKQPWTGELSSPPHLPTTPTLGILSYEMVLAVCVCLVEVGHVLFCNELAVMKGKRKRGNRGRGGDLNHLVLVFMIFWLIF